jgi:hypothetical protein
MYKIFVAILILAIPLVCMAEQVSVSLDRIAVVAPNPNNVSTENTLAAVHFSLPRIPDSSRIIYAEIVIPLDFSTTRITEDSILEFLAYPINHNWTPESNWNDPWIARGNDLDTLTSYSFSITMGNRDRSKVYLDVTPFVQEIKTNVRQNFGLMIFPQQTGETAFHLPQSIIQQITDSAILRITYR